MFDAANAGIDQIIDHTCAKLSVFRSQYPDDEQFVRGLVMQFVDQAASAPHGSGAISMALSAYRMALMKLEIDRLTDQLEMRQAALELMWAIDDHEEEQAKDGRSG